MRQFLAMMILASGLVAQQGFAISESEYKALNMQAMKVDVSSEIETLQAGIQRAQGHVLRWDLVKALPVEMSGPLAFQAMKDLKFDAKTTLADNIKRLEAVKGEKSTVYKMSLNKEELETFKAHLSKVRLNAEKPQLASK